MRRPSVYAVLALVAGCSRHRDVPRPRVVPERVADAGAPVAPPVAAPLRAAPCVLAVTGPVDVTPMHGRIDHLRLAAAGDRARVVAEVTSGPRPRSTLSVDVDARGAVGAPETLHGDLTGARVVAAPMAVGASLQTVTFASRHRDARSLVSAPYAYFVGARRSALRLFDVDELVTAATAEGWVAVSAGGERDCFETECVTIGRMFEGGRFNPRAGYSLDVVRPSGEAIAAHAVVEAPCVAPEHQTPDGEGDYLVMPDEGGPIPDRCVEARAERPFDVAVAARGDVVMVAYRTLRSVRFARVRADADAGADAPVTFGGDVGAPTIAFRGDALVAVWSQRDSVRAPYTLRHLAWNPLTTAQPPRPQVLATGAASATAPSLVARGDQLVLAWTEGDAVVRVGATRGALDDVTANAITVSSPESAARGPVLAATDARAWIAWTEHPAGRRHDQFDETVRVSPLQLP